MGQASETTGLGEQLSGTTWTAKAVSGAYESRVGVLLGRHCVQRRRRSRPPPIERWNGSTWTAQSLPRVEHTGATLVGISCGGATACTSVGATGDGFQGARRRLRVARRDAASRRSRRQLLADQTRRAAGRAAAGESAPSVVYQGGEGTTVAEGWNGTIVEAADHGQPDRRWERGPSVASACASSPNACVLVGCLLEQLAPEDGSAVGGEDGLRLGTSIGSGSGRIALGLQRGLVRCPERVCRRRGGAERQLPGPVRHVERQQLGDRHRPGALRRGSTSIS